MGEEVRGAPDVSTLYTALSLLIITIYRKPRRSTASPKQSWTSSSPTWRASRPCLLVTIDIVPTSSHLTRHNRTALLPALRGHNLRFVYCIAYIIKNSISSDSLDFWSITFDYHSGIPRNDTTDGTVLLHCYISDMHLWIQGSVAFVRLGLLIIGKVERD